jgi:predicted ABC-type ATPase
MTDEKKIIVIARPNGAGKTTFAREFLPAEAGLPVFVNADLIAAGLSLRSRHRCIPRGTDDARRD